MDLKIIVLVLLFTLSGCTQEQVQEPSSNMPAIDSTTPELIVENNDPAPDAVDESHEPEPVIQEYNESSDNSTPRRRPSPEIPTLKERETLPSCEGKEFSVLPVDMSKIYEINPLGNLAPPGHTFPTEHTYLHLNPGGSSTELFDLYSPADVYVTSISGGSGMTVDPFDYTIYFALCESVIGYYNHLKELSPELEKIKSGGNCNQNPGNTHYEFCENKLNLVKAGVEMGKVGGLQGNFDFGAIDMRETNFYVNPDRYGYRSLHIKCPYDYYGEEMKNVFFDLIKRNDENQCGFSAQDVEGTLQGNWFYGDSHAASGSDWDKYLALVYDDINPAEQVVSIGGVFYDASVWNFNPKNNGVINRNFSQITPDGKIYCFESTGQNGRILVELTSETELSIEHQNKDCSSSIAFQQPTSYAR